MTWEQTDIKHDTKNNCVRLSKGANHKEHPKAWEYILVEYETRPGVTVENLRQVRAVYDNAKGRWVLHLVCKDEIETPEAPGTETAGIDLGISNFAAVAYSTEDADLYPSNRLKQDGYYFPKEIAKRDDSGGEGPLDCTIGGRSAALTSSTPSRSTSLNGVLRKRLDASTSES